MVHKRPWELSSIDYIIDQLNSKKVQCRQLEADLNECCNKYHSVLQKLNTESKKIDTYIQENIKLNNIIKEKDEEIIHLKAELYDVLKNFK